MKTFGSRLTFNDLKRKMREQSREEEREKELNTMTSRQVREILYKLKMEEQKRKRIKSILEYEFPKEDTT